MTRARAALRARLRQRDERGAVAIMVALSSIVLFAMAGLTVDLGQGFSTRQAVQKSADYAALAGGYGTDLPTAATTQTCPGGANTLSGPRAVTGSQAVIDATAYLNSDPYNFGTTAAALTDCDMTNGEIIFGTVAKSGTTWTETYNNTRITVVTPPQRVDFGMSRLIGFTGVNIQRTATAGIFSQTLNRTLPYFAAQPCDFGQQTIAQPSNGTAASSVNLANNSDNGAQVETGLVTNPASNPATVAYPLASPTSLVINGTGLTGVTQVGFFESGATSAGPAPTILTLTAAATVTATKITIPDISSLNLAQDTWYVRVKTATGAWSAVSTGNGSGATLNALPLTVGTPNLVCAQGSSQGNFGSLLLPNPAGPNGQTDNIAYNIAKGLAHPLGAVPTLWHPPDGTCSSADTVLTPPAILWGSTGVDGTNCVDTKTGNVAADAALEGLLTGVGSATGLLVIPSGGAPNTGCAANGSPATTPFQGYTINNDGLSCFFVSSSTTIGDVDTSNYSLGGYAFNDSIWTSPRFVFIPVLQATPTTGGSNKYQIIDFRPAFITDQPNSATKNTGVAACSSTGCNGLTLTSNGKSLNSLQVVLINKAAIPPCPTSICSSTSPYTNTSTFKSLPSLTN